MAKKADQKLSPNFWLSEFLYSQTAEANGLSNKPSQAQIEAIRWVAVNVAQPIRDAIESPLSIKSGFRNTRVNRLIGGAEDSFHLYSNGRWAFDCHAAKLSLFDLMEVIISIKLPITKAIVELDQGVLHLQGYAVEYLVRDIIKGKKVYNFYSDYKKKGKIA